MPRALEDGLRALSRINYDTPLDGLESAVWSGVQQRKLGAGAASTGVQAAVAVAALALGLIVGLGAASKPSSSAYGSEVRVLSDDRLAPSIRLGGV